ncbi:nuclear transport factor 2 family protein [Salinibacterium sp. ZJ454]|uniref:nuclear transport factor 2 family protein n=1 Tax=Salinibacterium sp. ZJ454 TaxID=2708339 RepID=UPI001421162A|nr:nuclear transport factor 2 family protein [Salinibacterium sp. ZJ454]
MHESLSVEDRFEITQVLARYGHVMDGRDFAGLADVFLDDASFDVTSVGGPLYRGLSQLREFLALGDAVHPPFHVLANAWVFEDGDSVKSLSKWLTIDQATGLPRSGDYIDTWQKTGAGWRIFERQARVRWTGGAWGAGYEGSVRD